eukprot:421789-Pyramimonas_sp.AAC.1
MSDVLAQAAQVYQDRPTLEIDLSAEASHDIVGPARPLTRVVGPRAPMKSHCVLLFPCLAVWPT